MYISYATVRWHLEKLRSAFNVRSTRELVLMAGIPASPAPKAVRLTPRGKEVMELYVRGCSWNEIAKHLGISINGVRKHQEYILSQNECESMLELAVRYKAWLAAQQDGTPITDIE